MLDDMPLADEGAQIMRLRHFLAWLIPVILGFALLESIAFLLMRDWRSGAVGAVIFGYFVLLLAARSRAACGDLRAAVAITWIGILIADLLIILIQPALVATLSIIPLLAVAVALPYTSGRALHRLFGISWVATVFVAAVGELGAPASNLPGWFNSLFHISSLAAAAAMVLLLLRQFSGRLTENLVQTQAANVALHESESRYRIVTETASDAIITIDEDSTIRFANCATEQIFGYDRAELLGQPITLLMPEPLCDRHRMGMRRYLVSGERRASWAGVTFVGRHKRGGEIPLELSYSEFHKDGRRFFTGIMRDITERKRAEEQRLVLERRLLETQKLDSLAVLAGGIAHDFNNVLTTIMGNAELAMFDLPRHAPIYESLESIIAASRRVMGLTQQMLAYSGKSRFVLQLIDLNTLLNEVNTLLHGSILGCAEIVLQLAPELPPVEADLSQIHQLVMNLLINAGESIDAQHGQVTLTTSVRYADCAYIAGMYLAPDLPEGKYVCLEVADNGCGIDMATQARIFDPFFTTKFVGRGLGLAAVLGVVRGHRGALQVQSAPGHGTTFTILLPPAAPPTTERTRGHLS